MLLIVAHHYVVNSGLTAPDGPIYANQMSWRSLFLLILGAWGKTGINCFVLITGYFMCKSQITVKKFIKLLAEVMFYKLLFYAIFLLSGYESFSIKAFVKAILPITGINQNFTGCFLLFYLCIPFLNILIENLNERQHIRLLILCGVIYIFFGTMPFLSASMNYVSWFIVLYFIAAYIRLYPKKMFDHNRIWLTATLVSVLVSAASVVACTWIGTIIDRDMAYYFVVDSNTLLAVATGITSFLLFKNIKIKYNPLINTIAASTFGVLLIHANSDTMRQWLWRDVLNNVGMYASPYLILHALGSVLCIFCICTIIDHVRIVFLEKPFMKWICHAEFKLSKVIGKNCRFCSNADD